MNLWKRMGDPGALSANLQASTSLPIPCLYFYKIKTTKTVWISSLGHLLYKNSEDAEIPMIHTKKKAIKMGEYCYFYMF